MRRNTVVSKPSTNRRANASSQNDQSKDLNKSANRRQTQLIARKSDNMRSDCGSPDDETKSKKLPRGKTYESITQNSKDGDTMNNVRSTQLSKNVLKTQ